MGTAGEVRVGVGRGRRPVRGPARMRNAGIGRHLRRLAVEVGHPRNAAHATQIAIDVQSKAAGIIATIFEPAQPFHQNRDNVALRNRADDATHGQAPQ